MYAEMSYEIRILLAFTVMMMIFLLIAYLTWKERKLLEKISSSEFYGVLYDNHEELNRVRVRGTQMNAEAFIQTMTIGATFGVVGALATRELVLSLLQTLSSDQRDNLREKLQSSDEKIDSKSE